MTAAEWDRRYGGDARVRAWAETPNRLLVAETERLEPGRALDLACGLGRNAIWLAERGWSVTAVDFSPVAIAGAGDRAARHGVTVELVTADLTSYTPETSAYDLVVVLFLQLPRAAMHRLVTHAAAAVRPDGTFLLVGHDVLNASEGVGGPSELDVLYTPEDVVSALGGLEVERAERYRRDVPGERRPAIDCLVRARRIMPPARP